MINTARSSLWHLETRLNVTTQPRRPHPRSLFALFVPPQEEEDGSEDDGDSRTQFPVSVRPDLSMLSFLDHMDEEAEGFVSPVDELSPSKTTTDMRLSNLHSATT